MRSRSPLHIRFVRYGLLVGSLLLVAGIAFVAIGSVNQVEADPLSGYKTEATR
ncbi:hypothetical protein [Aureimonas sp. AU12]|uniref:hypothetical protein n=1 Tax=Aureimonas sp. AU12 TaxID=1638161 RepID=UPI000B24FC41|nr:hypothetical protein [Aureimonas sp. AU12]